MMNEQSSSDVNVEGKGKAYVKYGLPEHYNPSDYPPVRMREKRNPMSHDQSETERKRRSKNRLSQRRSTGPVPLEILEQAVDLGPYNTLTVVK